MSDVFSISVGALQAFQSAIDVTSNNIANANTPGYVKETLNLVSAPPQSNGLIAVGDGVLIGGITRSFNQATANQLNASQSSLGQLNALQTYSSQIDNLVGTTAGGLSTALQSFYSAWSNVANAPTSTATRQALLGSAQSVAASLQSANTQLNALNSDINARISADVTQINTYVTSIATLNKQIVIGTAQDGGQPPNELIDQRDQLVSQLSTLTSISTTTDSNGSLNVFLGTSQPLVLQGATTTLTTVPNQYDAGQFDISSSQSVGHVINGAITSGDLGGLLAARSQVVEPAKNQIGQIATALTQTANTQQNSGLDLSGQRGVDIFSLTAPVATASSLNKGTATATASIANIGALTSKDYVLGYLNGVYSLTDAADNTPVPFTGAGTAGSPFVADGLSIQLSTTPASGDTFLIQPTAQAAGNIAVAIASPTQIAAAGAVQATAASINAGSASISSGSVVDPTNANLLSTATIAFTSPTTYTVNGTSFTYSSGANITQNGWQVQITGTPAIGDTFTVQKNTGGTGDNRNALASANAQTQPVLQNGTVSVAAAVSALITGIGSQAQQINTAQAAQTAVNTQANNNQQSVSGVNLDEEAAQLLKWQEAYQASAKALQIGSSLFQNLLTAVQSA